MDKNFKRISAVVIAALMIELVLCCIYAYNQPRENVRPAVESSTEQAQTREEPSPQVSRYDTTYLDFWCGEPIGHIRMIGGWYYTENTIETQDGKVWELNTESIDENAFYLVWFDDMDTPDITDDQILKVWSEVYN